MYVKSNIDLFTPKYREFEDAEVETMTAKEFDELPLSDQISIYNRFPEAYSRLTSKSIDDTTAQDAPEPTPEAKARQFADEFEQRLDNALKSVFHSNE